MTDLHRLPEGWDWAKIEDVAEVIPGNSPPSSTYNDSGDGLPFYQGKSEFGDLYPTPEKWCSEPTKIAAQDDVLVSVRAPVGPTNLCPDRSCIGRGLAAIRPREDISSRYVLWAIRSRERDLQAMGTGTTFDSITSKELRTFKIPVAPEQTRASIVAKIEELFSNLEAGCESLKTANRQLERYRLSVLQAAVEGRLTAGWRRTQSPADPADELVRRVEEQDEVNKYKSRDKMAPLPDPPPFQIPNSWRWVRVGDIARRIRYGTSEKADREYRGLPVIRMGNIEGGRLQYDNLKFMPEDWEDEEKFLLEDGDVLFNRTNSAKLVGKTAVYKEGHPRAVFASYLVRVRLYEDVCNPDLLSYYINSVHGRVYIRGVTSQQVGQANVNATKLASMPFPLPPIAEQKQIAEEVERLLSIADDAAATSDSEARRASKLRQSILRDAFSGKLLGKSA